jgi:hypothetical protein
MHLGRTMNSVLAIAGTSGFVISSVTVAVARMIPSHQGALQDWAGGLIMGSAILMVFGFPLM